MITFQNFLVHIEERFRGVPRERRALRPHGPKANKHSRASQRRDVVDKIALSKAGFRRPTTQSDYFPQNHHTSNSPDHNTTVSTYQNQSDFARHNIPPKFKRTDKPTISGEIRRKVVPTKDRVRVLKALRKQLGGTRTSKPVHDVTILSEPHAELPKNSKTDLISRGKSFKKELQSVPDVIRQSGGKPGDKVSGTPAEIQILPSNLTTQQRKELRSTGAKKRGKLYRDALGGSKTNPVTKMNIGTLT
jgi:hypothetical protein